MGSFIKFILFSWIFPPSSPVPYYFSPSSCSPKSIITKFTRFHGYFHQVHLVPLTTCDKFHEYFHQVHPVPMDISTKFTCPILFSPSSCNHNPIITMLTPLHGYSSSSSLPVNLSSSSSSLPVNLSSSPFLPVNLKSFSFALILVKFQQNITLHSTDCMTEGRLTGLRTRQMVHMST